MNDSTRSTNRLAVVSLLAVMLTIISFCIGLAPFLPGTAPICYPVAILLGLVAFFCGLTALRQIRASGERGGWMAWIGVVIGLLAVLVTLCAAATGLLLTALAGALWTQFQSVLPTPTP